MKYIFSTNVFKYLWRVVLILVACIIPEYFSQNGGKQSLKLVQIITRHGDRNPGLTYPTDPYKDESNWPGGYSQLTDNGKLRMYNLGEYLREQYKNIISQSYTSKDVYMLSSDYDRNIRSAMALLAGLYKENNLNSTWNPDIKWDPIPVHTVAKEHDRIFEVTESCPKLDEIFNFVYNESDWAKFIFSEENKETLDYIARNAGVDNFSGNLHYLGFISLTLKFQKEQGLEIPSWGETLLNLNLSINVHNTFGARLDWLRIRVGPLLSDLITNMEEAASGAKTTVPMRFWMSHDISLFVMITTLDLYEQSVMPDYGFSIIFELHERNGQNSSLEHIIEVYIKNETSANSPVLFHIPECPSPCTLEKFKRFAQKFIPEDWNRECQEKMELNSPLHDLGDLPSYSSTLKVMNTKMFLVICACVFIAIFGIYVRKQNMKKSLYETL